MIQEDKWSWKRFGMIVIIFIATLSMTAGTLFLQGELAFQWVLMASCGAVFSLFFVLYLEWNRRKQGVFHEKANNFVRITIAYILCSGLTVGMSFLPEYGRPVLVLAGVMTLVSTPFCGLLVGCYCSVILAFSGENNTLLLICYLLLSICGCIIVLYTLDNRQRLWPGWMVLTSNFCIIALLSLLDEKQFSVYLLEYSLIGSIISCLIVTILCRIWNDKMNIRKDEILKRIIDRDYVLVKAMKNYSKADFEHAKRVSYIARNCARMLDIDVALTAAAGFYYRIGRLEGEPYVENGVHLARKHKFPPELIQLLSEYNGEQYLPSSVESALVHIVDNLVAKFDVLDKEMLSSTWNQDILVYQTLNENSAKGLYDKSGLSMNMFLRVRDYLIKEAGLYDSSCGE